MFNNFYCSWSQIKKINVEEKQALAMFRETSISIWDFILQLPVEMYFWKNSLFNSKVKREAMCSSCSRGSCPWSPSSTGRLWLSKDQSKHYHYRANQQVGLVRLWSEDWALFLLIHFTQSLYRLWIANHAPVQYRPSVVAQCLHLQLCCRVTKGSLKCSLLTWSAWRQVQCICLSWTCLVHGQDNRR